MKLTLLEPSFMKIETEYSYHMQDIINGAQGIMFLCPKCYITNDGPVGTHSVMCWFANTGVPNSLIPGPGRWQFSGTSYDDLSLYPSVFLTGPGCGWHGWIKNGEVT